jgi:hypothetical protein
MLRLPLLLAEAILAANHACGNPPKRDCSSGQLGDVGGDAPGLITLSH